MERHTLKKNEWHRFFELVSKTAQGQRVELEIAGLDIGAQIETEWVLFEGIAYDENEDLLSIQTPALEHTIQSPVEIVVMDAGASVKMIAIKDNSDRVQVIHFDAPLLLEPRRESAAHP